MRPLTAAELLSAWEQGIHKPLLPKTLHLLSLACPEMDGKSLSDMSIGERDRRLLQLREWMFGSRLTNMARCPQCKEYLEWEINVNDIRRLSATPQDPTGEFSLELDDYHVHFRLPSSMDLSAIMADGHGRIEPAKLLSRCIFDCQHQGRSCDTSDLPDKLRQAINRRMEKEDPQADIRMALDCPACSHQWEARFDIVSYLWIEINRWAERLLADIHRLAKAYGWSEHDILQMSPWRRQVYLGMVKG